MRLICPNCSAQYEVGDDAVPEAGRDVQCSNCGQTWFEKRSEPGESPEPQVDPDTEETAVAPPPRELDPAVAEILREEAAFEQAARQSDANPIETQPDLDLSKDPEPQDGKTDQSGGDLHEQLARLRGEDPAVAAATVTVTAAATATKVIKSEAEQSEQLPDIDELNASLRPDAVMGTDDTNDDPPKKRSGFRRGFILAVMLVLIALAVYIFADQISEALPQFESQLTSYGNWVDGLRIQLDQQIQGMMNSAEADVPAE